jgi:hypothetical protein
MRRQSFQNLMLWLACLSYVVQAAAGADKVLCFDSGEQAAAHLSDAHDNCSHAEAESEALAVPPHDEGDECPCTDIKLRSDPGRSDDLRVELPPVEEIEVAFLCPLLAVAHVEWRALAAGDRFPREPASALTHPDAPRLRCVILVI